MSRNQSNADEYRRIYELVQRQYDQACKDFEKACEEADSDHRAPLREVAQMAPKLGISPP